MHKKIGAMFVMASALAFFLLALSPSYAGMSGGGLKAAVLLAQQAPQSQPETESGPFKTPPPAQPKPQPAAPSTDVHPPAQPEEQKPSSQPPAQPAPVPPAQPIPKPGAVPPQPQVQPPPEQPSRPAFLPPSQPAKQPARRGDVSFNFDDADVYSVIQTIFGDILRVNYIVDPAVKGRVTFRSVEPVAKEDVLPLMEVILRLNGIGIVEEGGLYRIIPIADISKEPAPVGMGRNPEKVQINGKALVQIVPIHYVQSSEVVRVLTPFLSKNAVIVDVPKSNYIVIVDTDANVKRLLQLVNTFDSEELKQVTPRVFVYAVQNGKAKDVANILQQIFLGAKPTSTTPAKPATQPAKPVIPGQVPQPQAQIVMGHEAGGPAAVVSEVTKIIPDEVTNSIIVLATPEDYQLIHDTLESIDIQQRQVVIEAVIVQVTLTDNLSFGLSWSMNTDLRISGLKPFKNNFDLTGDGTRDSNVGINTANLDPSKTPGSGFTFVGYDPTGNVRAVLTALEDRSKAKVVAAPHILVSDNQEARIQIGQQIPLATSTSSSVGATGTTSTDGQTIVNPVIGTSTIQYKDIGIILKVKPQVNDSGLISLEFSQEISSVGTSVQVGGLDEVTINKTEANSNLIARDGQTIVIGGLIREDTSRGTSGLPFLSRIPIIGALFGTDSDKNQRTELIILLTPHVVRNGKEALNVTHDYINRYKGATKDKEIDKFLHRGEEQPEPGTKGPGEIPSPMTSPELK